MISCKEYMIKYNTNIKECFACKNPELYGDSSRICNIERWITNDRINASVKELLAMFYSVGFLYGGDNTWVEAAIRINDEDKYHQLMKVLILK